VGDSAADANQSSGRRAIEVQELLTSDDPMARSPDDPIFFFRDIILRVLGGRTSEQWIAQYGSSHQHPVNRVCHTLGIPTILLSTPVFVASIFFHRLWLYGLALFLIGWIFQFIGHAFEGKPPEFFHDWRFLFVGVRWWWAKIHGKA
jgi:hypothetical protein